MNLDLQRKVRFSARKKTVNVKVDKKCRIGRTLADLAVYMEEHPGTPVVELDTVEGKKGGKCLLTVYAARVLCISQVPFTGLKRRLI